MGVGAPARDKQIPFLLDLIFVLVLYFAFPPPQSEAAKRPSKAKAFPFSEANPAVRRGERSEAIGLLTIGNWTACFR